MKHECLAAIILIALSFLLCFVRNLTEVNATDGFRVHNLDTGIDYTAVQEAIDANETQNGHTISVDAGTYYEQIVVNKSISLIGQNRTTTILNGNGTDTVILIMAHNATIREFTITNGTTGIRLDHSNNTMVAKNNLIDNGDALNIRYANNCTITENLVGNNTGRGILLTLSHSFNVSHNSIFHNGWDTLLYGMNANDSSYGLIAHNWVYDNYYDGIGLLKSTNCTIIENVIEDNLLYGIWQDSSSGNRVFHNSFINNRGKQATAPSSTCIWDDGYTSGGNYWSDYAGVDINRDGIGDTAHFVDVNNNTDRYPLMGMFTSFEAQNHTVTVVSNSTISDFTFIQTNGTVRMTVTNMSSTQTVGFCRMTIPHDLMLGPYSVIVDQGATQLLHFNDTLFDNGTHRWIYFAYPHSAHDVVVVPEFSSVFMLPLVLAGVIFVSLISRGKQSLRRLQS